jgi:F-type H+-transporting ATPase subunit epsilon
MADKLKLEMVTPYKRVLSEEVDDIQAPGTVGELGILPGHTPLLTTLKIGEFRYRKGNEQFHVAINWGYMEVEDDKVSVLVDTAEPADQIDLDRSWPGGGGTQASVARRERIYCG